MYLKSACAFVVAIPLLWTLHLNNFTKRYDVGTFHLNIKLEINIAFMK